jgi:hypothetical protein
MENRRYKIEQLSKQESNILDTYSSVASPGLSLNIRTNYSNIFRREMRIGESKRTKNKNEINFRQKSRPSIGKLLNLNLFMTKNLNYLD